MADRNCRCRIKYWICDLCGVKSKRTTAYRLRLHSLRQRIPRAKAYLQVEPHARAISTQAEKTGPVSTPTGDLIHLRGHGSSAPSHHIEFADEVREYDCAIVGHCGSPPAGIYCRKAPTFGDGIVGGRGRTLGRPDLQVPLNSAPVLYFRRQGIGSLPATCANGGGHSCRRWKPTT